MLTANIVPAYLYNQYKDDANLKAFVDFFNITAQDYLTSIAALNIPVVMEQKGDMLDYVGNNLFGVPRPYYAASLMPDDVYHDVLMWYLYLGDGNKQNIRNLKKRIARFCKINQSAVSIAHSTLSTEIKTTITLTTSVKSNLFRYLVKTGQIRLPENNWVITLV